MLSAIWAVAPGTLTAGEHLFVERSGELGIDFVHRRFATPEKYMPETLGAGVALFDADGDGRLDLYFVQGAPVVPGPGEPAAVNRLFVQQEDGRFRDATEAAGVGHPGLGMGVTWGDVDGDGDVDLFVTNVGADLLYLNDGEGRFEDATAAAGVGSTLWGTSTGFFDADGDSDLDLYVVNYVDWSLGEHPFCGSPARQIRVYCGPWLFDGLPDLLYLNDGGGRFREVGAEAGVPHVSEAKGLGVGFGDVDDDGDTDVYVANDSTSNFLLLGDGRGRFEPSGLLAGVSYNASGIAEGGMGVEIGDVDGDGRQDIFVTNMEFETNTLYLNTGDGFFSDLTDEAGLATPSLPMVGFGTVLVDHDADGDLDLVVTNGHVTDNIESFGAEGAAFRQPTQFYENLGGGSFRELPDALGLPKELVGRGAASGDLDGDGALDLVITQNGGPAFVLMNRHPARGHALAVRLRGPRGNPHGFGARVELRAGGRRQVRDARSASSYLSQGTADLHFGLGEATLAEELIVRWPSGEVERHGPLDAGFLYTVAIGSADVEATRFRPRERASGRPEGDLAQETAEKRYHPVLRRPRPPVRRPAVRGCG